MTPTAHAPALRVGGLTPLTTIDYPGELATVIFCQCCPWRCRYCHNWNLHDASAQSSIPWSTIRRFLIQRKGLLDAVVFSGGEPTAQHDLTAALSEVRDLGFKIGLHTGGAYPERLRQLLPLLDWVGLDIKALAADYEPITGVADSGKLAWESLSLLLEAGIPLEVRTTVMPNWSSADVGVIAQMLADVGVRNYALQRCDSRHALDASLPEATVPLQQLSSEIAAERFARLTLRDR